MRTGKNPLRGRDPACLPPQKTTLAVVAWIPDLSGYHVQALELLELSLASARANTDIPFDILVLDNGCCREVREWLQVQLGSGHVNYVLSCERNLGTLNGKRLALLAAPGRTVVYADCDVYFQPGWLDRLLEVQAAFPEAGMIAGFPGRHFESLERQQQVARKCFSIRQDVEIEDGDWIPESDLRTWAESVGQEPESYLEATRHISDLRLTRSGTSALAGGGHFAYCTTKDMILRLPHRNWARLLASTGEGEIIESVLLQEEIPVISTVDPVFYHMGNVIAEEWLQKEQIRLKGLDPSRATSRPRYQPYREHWAWGHWRVRKILRALGAWVWARYYT